MSLFGDPQALLSALVRVPSPSGQEGPLADQLELWAQSAGLGCERIGHSLVIRVGSRRPGEPRLLLNTHHDTVPVGAGWHGDPLDGTWRDGRLCARGANDAKASVAAMLAAAYSLRNEELRGELIVSINAQEETCNAGMAEVLDHIGRPDAAVTGEPTGLEVVRAQSGLAVLEAHWGGSSCHAAHVARADYDSALAKAAKAVAALPGHLEFEGEHELLGRSTIAPTIFTSGVRHNVIPDEAKLVLDARIAPPIDADACLALVQAYLPDARITLRSDRLGPVETAADHPLVQAALVSAGNSKAIGSNTLSDMALLPGIPAIKCGPGQTIRSHTPNEFVLLDELLAGVRFYSTLVPRALLALTTEKTTP
ncbi:MAG: acetylornithine deacetylase [Gammaproteobacteria bacterium]|jgi:acetylornithine deacetylase